MNEQDDKTVACVYEDNGGSITLVVGKLNKKPLYVHSNFEGIEDHLCECLYQLIHENTVTEWENNEVDTFPTHKGHGEMIFSIGIDYQHTEFSINVCHRNAGASGQRFLKAFFNGNIFDE